MSAKKRAPLENGQFYHVFNRGNNKEDLFKESMNYDYFLFLWQRHISPVAKTFAFCLLKNHFHFLVKIKKNAPVRKKDSHSQMNPVEQRFANFFNAYAKAINKKYGRTGKLFEERFRRKLVTSDTYFDQLIYYIHANPMKHNFIEDFRDYGASSYHLIATKTPSFVESKKVLKWFGGTEGFKKFHKNKYRQLEDEEKFYLE